VKTSKTHFEQIPVEIVKKVAEEFRENQEAREEEGNVASVETPAQSEPASRTMAPAEA
jgi:hypothetical protein